MIASPCIDVCKMDEASGLCQGCYRSLAEIAAWSGASDTERVQILAAVSQRRARLDPAADPVCNCTDS
ncbi:MAG: DUF1289 domain-containing protein [Proteobacteria bacterium]|nr:DUF1289 domain-containing protein [Pseudomonadota bacterium]